MSRFNNREIFENRLNSYKYKRLERNVNSIVHYDVAKLKHLSAKQIGQLQLINHTWDYNDKYYKIAHKYYGDSELWWVIAWFNQRPTEAHVSIGDVIRIPLPLDLVLNYMEV